MGRSLILRPYFQDSDFCVFFSSTLGMSYVAPPRLAGSENKDFPFPVGRGAPKAPFLAVASLSRCRDFPVDRPLLFLIEERMEGFLPLPGPFSSVNDATLLDDSPPPLANRPFLFPCNGLIQICTLLPSSFLEDGLLPPQ